MTSTLLIIGLLTGTLTGLTGASGMSILISGLLIAGLDIRDVIGLTFAVTLANAVAAIGPYLRAGNWAPRITWSIAIPAVASVFLGNSLGRSTSSKWLTGIIIAALFSAGLHFLRGRKKPSEESPAPRKVPLMILAGAGVIIGTIMGMMGGGGSIFISLLLILALRLPLRIALGSSIIIMGLAAIPGLYLNLQQAHLNLEHAAWLIMPGMLAAIVAGKLAHRVPERGIEIGLGLYLVLVSTALIFTRIIPSG